MTADPIAAVLDQLAAHAEQIARLDAREAASAADLNRRVADLALLASKLDNHVSALAAGADRTGGHEPAPARRWWKLAGKDRAQAIADLREWVDQVYRPGYGQLAGSLGSCWDEHALCLYALDILAELWFLLYQPGQRTAAVLSAQAEYQARILPALAEQMMTETGRCRHARERLTAVNPARRTS